MRNTSFATRLLAVAAFAETMAKPMPSLIIMMPVWINAKVHPTWFFNNDEHLELDGPGAKSSPHAAVHLYATLMGGFFTAVQSVGVRLDGDLRDRARPHTEPAPAHLTGADHRRQRQTRANPRW
jgi:hypothetical protein